MWVYNNELFHYGVLGMKWGIRKASKTGSDYNYRSIGQKFQQRRVNKISDIEKHGSYTKKSDRLAAKSKKASEKGKNKKADKLMDKSKTIRQKEIGKFKQNKYNQNKKLDIIKQRDRNREIFARNTSVGAEVARNLLMTPIGAGNYSRNRASGKTIFASSIAYSSLWDSKYSEIATARMQIDSSAIDSRNFYLKNKRKR